MSRRNQRRELEHAADRSDWHVVLVIEDAGISGSKGRDKRPGLDVMLDGAARREFDVVAAWSEDRLGRSLQDLVSTLNDSMPWAATYTSISKPSTPRRPQDEHSSR